MPGCIIVSNGTISDYSFYKSKISDDDYIICADGAIRHVLSFGSVPDLWLGDFDSCDFSDILKNHPELKKVETITLNPHKDVTDTHYACIEAIKRGYTHITLWGACGGRLDHMLSNIHLLEFLKNKNISAKIQDEKNTLYLCSGHVKFIKERKYLSLIPLDSSVMISGSSGLKYPLKDFTLTRDISMGVSNEITGTEASVKFESGLVIAIESDD